MISDYGTDFLGKCEGFREEQPECKSLREGTGVDYDGVAVYVGDGRVDRRFASGESCQWIGTGLYRNNTFY